MRLDLNPPNGSKGSLNVRIPTKIMKSVEVKAGLQSIWRETTVSELASEDLQKKIDPLLLFTTGNQAGPLTGQSH